MKLIHNVYPMPLINITWRNRNTNLKPMVIERSLLRLHSYGMNCLSIWRIQIQSNNFNLASIASHLALNSLPCHFWSRTISSSCSSWDFLRCALTMVVGMLGLESGSNSSAYFTASFTNDWWPNATERSSNFRTVSIVRSGFLYRFSYLDFHRFILAPLTASLFLLSLWWDIASPLNSMDVFHRFLWWFYELLCRLSWALW